MKPKAELPPRENNKKGNIVLKKLTKEQKEKLLSGQIGLAGLAAGAGASALMGFVDKPNADIVVENNGENNGSESVVIHTKAPFAMSVNDNMAFSEAFQTARTEVGPGGFFEYKNQLYNTYTKEEWDTLPPEDQHRYWASIDESTEHVTSIGSNTMVSINPDNPIESTASKSDEYLNDQQGLSAEEQRADNEVALDGQKIEVAYFEAGDTNGDGVADSYVVDANGNEFYDVLLDTDYDGRVDTAVLDFDSDSQEIVSINPDMIELVETPLVPVNPDNVHADELVIADDLEIDAIAEEELIPGFDNDEISTGLASNTDADSSFDPDADISDFV